MRYKANDKVKHIKTNLTGRVVASEDTNPEGKIIVECRVIDNGNIGYQILTELPSDFQLIE